MSKIMFVTEVKNKITYENYISVRNLYMPIVGMESITLYSILNDYNYINKSNPTYHYIKDISDTMGISLDDLIKAKNKLEAVGLLRTFEKSDNNTFIFLLNPPLKPEYFRKNQMLFQKCVKQIGEVIFERFFFATKTPKMIKDEFKEVTIKYQDVFDITVQSQESTLEIPMVKFKNKKDAIKGLMTAQFVKFISGETVSPSQLALIQRLQNLGISSQSINEIVAYTFEINDRFVSNHIEKIANDMISKGITNPVDIKKELDGARKFQKSHHSDIKQQIVSSSTDAVQETSLSWNDIFDTLGGEL